MNVPHLNYNHVTFGFIMDDRQLQYNINIFIILANYFLHNWTFLPTTPPFGNNCTCTWILSNLCTQSKP